MKPTIKQLQDKIRELKKDRTELCKAIKRLLKDAVPAAGDMMPDGKIATYCTEREWQKMLKADLIASTLVERIKKR